MSAGKYSKMASTLARYFGGWPDDVFKDIKGNNLIIEGTSNKNVIQLI